MTAVRLCSARRATLATGCCPEAGLSLAAISPEVVLPLAAIGPEAGLSLVVTDCCTALRRAGVFGEISTPTMRVTCRGGCQLEAEVNLKCVYVHTLHLQTSLRLPSINHINTLEF